MSNKQSDYRKKDEHRIWKIYGTDYKEMTKKILAAADLAARIGDHGKRIGIKPNLVVASPAEFGGTTHPQVVAGIIEYLQERDFRNLVIAEGSWVGDRTSEAFEYCGYNRLSGEYGVPLVDTQKQKWHEVDCAGMKLNITNVVDEIDFLINVPVMKGHCQTKVTCALKNMKGVIPNSEKRRFHRMGLHEPIAHLSAGIHQDFILVDSICGDLTMEDGGDPVTQNRLAAALDPVLVDAWGCSVIGIEREEPLLAVNGDGVRFMEEDIEYCRRNTILKEMKDPFMWSLFDANYFDYVYGWGSDPTVPTVANGTPEKLAAYIEKGSVLTADSIEELAEKMEIDPAQLKATVDHYNELCAEGFDYDFGKPSKYMKPVDTAPFYAVKRVYQVSAIVDGLKINVDGQVLDMDNQPMEGLYAAGNCSGGFYGDVDYSLDTMGLSIGRCVTFGYLVGKDVAAL